MSDETDPTDARLLPRPAFAPYWRVWRSETDDAGTVQTHLGAFPTLDEAYDYAKRNGGHQVQEGDDGEVTNVDQRFRWEGESTNG